MNNKDLYISKSGQAWEIVIGMEVHAQILSESKLFSASSTKFGAEPNTHVSFVDAAFPGMLPVINKHCVDQAIKTGLGLNATINRNSFFDRKNYFYPDLPQGYQISQFHQPIVSEGYLDINLEDGTSKRIRIERLHIEQDAAKCFHDKSPTESFVDLNRAGVGLMEIVTKPDISSAFEASEFLKELRSILRYLETCDGNMDEGSMRADINISVRKPGDPLGVRNEVKNVNSIRFISQAISYEVARQVEVIESGGTIDQETRLFDPSTGETRVMRSKEDALDYRYFPDPDLPMLVVTDERINAIKERLPELPKAKVKRYTEEYSLPEYDAKVLCSEKEIAAYFELCIAMLTESEIKHSEKLFKLLSNWIIVELFSRLKKANLDITTCPVTPSSLIELISLIEGNVISGKIAKDVMDEMFATGKGAKEIVKSKGLQQITDTSQIEAMVDKLLSEQKDKVDSYKSGKVQLFGFFVGQLMNMSGGKINPQLANEILSKKLS